MEKWGGNIENQEKDFLNNLDLAVFHLYGIFKEGNIPHGEQGQITGALSVWGS